MLSYLERYEQMPAPERWPAVRRWIFEEGSEFFKELREHRPVLVTPVATLVSRFTDCREVLLSHEAFSVALYRPKQGDYWMAQDDTPQHWREKSIMKAVLDREQVPLLREFVAAEAEAIFGEANGEIDAVNELARAVPIALVQQKFGFEGADPKELFEWSYWNQYDAFHNQPFDRPVVPDPGAIVAKRESANARMRDYLTQLVARRAAELKAGRNNNDMVTRLLKLSLSGSVQFGLPSLVLNVGGLLIGAVETTSQAVIQSIAQLLNRPAEMAGLRAALDDGNASLADGYVFEALRFHPISPYMFRVCEKRTVLSRGTDYATQIEPGTIVLPLVHSAMFDETAFDYPDNFNAARGGEHTFHLGLGIHECLGSAIAEVLIPELVQKTLRLPGIRAPEPIDYRNGPFPEFYRLRWDLPN